MNQMHKISSANLIYFSRSSLIARRSILTSPSVRALINDFALVPLNPIAGFDSLYVDLRPYSDRPESQTYSDSIAIACDVDWEEQEPFSFPDDFFGYIQGTLF